MIVDNFLAKKYSSIKSCSELSNYDLSNSIVLITSDDLGIYDEIREILYTNVSREKCIELFPKPPIIYDLARDDIHTLRYELWKTARQQTCEYILDHMDGNTRLFETRYNMLEYLMEDIVDDKLGLFLEFGVFQGLTTNFVAAMKPLHLIYGFDSFEGLPENWYIGSEKGVFDVHGKIPEGLPNVRFVKGYFEDSLPPFLQQHKENCAFIHIDCDLYSSAKTVFSLLGDRIASGTVIQFDEYFNYPRWQNHEYKAFQEFISDHHLKYEYLGYANLSGSEVSVRIK